MTSTQKGGNDLSNKIRENDYLHLSARIRVLENRLLSHDRLERMLDARTAEEAAKVLTECGYRELGAVTPAGVEEMLSEARKERFAELEKLTPDRRVLDLFRVKYDYHNVKVLLKAGYMGVSAQELLTAAGRYTPTALAEATSQTNPTLAQAAAQAGEVLSATGDGQQADFILDRACFAELLEIAQTVGSAYMTDYVRALIDAANLRAAVRVRRMGEGKELLERALIPGGKVDTAAIANAEPAALAALYGNTPLAAAAEEGVKAAEGGALTAFERLCDNAVTAVVREARKIPFGEQPVVAYLYAREAEETAVRIILNGKLAGLSRATMEERLRDAYV